MPKTNRVEIPAEKLDKLRERLKRNCTPMPSGCWEWNLSRSPQGYGITTPATKRSMGAHRVSYAAFKGVVPANMYVCHTCDNPPCINPEHLWLGTDTDNARDMAKKGRNKTQLAANKCFINGVKHCQKGLHPLVGDNLRPLPSGFPACKKCHQIYNSKRSKRLIAEKKAKAKALAVIPEAVGKK